jgi:DNA topoisomerase-1
MTITMDRAMELIEMKEKADAPIYEYDGQPVTKGVGRFGPYIKWAGMFISVNKKYDFDNLSNEDIETLIKDKIQKEKDKLIVDWEEEGIRIEKARWGRHNIIKGKIKVEIGKEVDPLKVTLEKAKELIEKKTPKKKAPAKKKSTKRTTAKKK